MGETNTLVSLPSTFDITRLNVPRANNVVVQKAFSVAGPIIWNNLHTLIRDFVSVFHLASMCTMIVIYERLINFNC